MSNSINLSSNQKGNLYYLMVKYDKINENFANSLSRVIQGSNTDEDLMTISQNMDYNDIDFNDSQILEEILGEQISMMFFQF